MSKTSSCLVYSAYDRRFVRGSTSPVFDTGQVGRGKAAVNPLRKAPLRFGLVGDSLRLGFNANREDLGCKPAKSACCS